MPPSDIKSIQKYLFRKWFFEKRDWIVSDEVEDETEEMTEEELVAEEEVSKSSFWIFSIICYFPDGDSYSGCGGEQ